MTSLSLWPLRFGKPLRTLMLCVHGAGIAVLALAVALTMRAGTPPAWQLGLIALLLLLSEADLMHIRFGHNRHAFTCAEAGLVIALAVLPVGWILLILAPASLLTHTLQGKPLEKTLYNASTTTVSAALAAGAAYVAGDPSLQAGIATQVASMAAAAIVYSTSSGLLVSAAVALSQGRHTGEVYRGGSPIREVLGLTNLLIGLGVLALVLFSPATLFAVPPMLIVLFLFYRGYLQAKQDRDVWRQLEQAAKELDLLEQHALAEAVVRRAALLLSADSVELYLATADGKGRTYRGDPTGLIEEPEDLLDAGRPALATTVATPLEAAYGVIGRLQLRWDGPVTLSRREKQLLSTFAHTISSALGNARLYEEMRDQAERNAYAATHDPLTGLANRELLAGVGREAVRAAHSGTVCALLLFDLDHFKEVNDTLGHGAGDEILRSLAQRLREEVGSTATVARLGGDEFAVLLPAAQSADAADREAQRLLQTVAEPVEVQGLRLVVETSAGVACAPGDASTVEELLRCADVALYQAKGARGRWQHYAAERDGSSVERLSLVPQLTAALDNDEILVHYQPQVGLQTGEIVGVETLARWAHPSRGLLQPTEFMPVMEHTGLVRAFSQRVVECGVAECARWQKQGRKLTVAVNLSARNLLDSQLPADVGRVLARHDVPPESLVLEITETAMLRELEVVEDVLAGLRAQGVQLSVDDFGTGYSSLAFLQRVAVNEIKVDRSFVTGMLGNDSDRAIVRATLQLAQGLGLRTVAEGVENEELREMLAGLGCQLGQGYHLGRPMPAEELRKLLGMNQALGRVIPLRRVTA